MPNRPFRLLLNAQPFGFGPAAAISAIAPHLAGLGELSFAGSCHSGELQERRLFHSMHTLSPEAGPSWRQAIASCDVLVTAMDTELALLALEMGRRVVFYDALLWFWGKGEHWGQLCRMMSHPMALYLAQDFMGVRERLAMLACADAVQVVPPLVSAPSTVGVERSKGRVLVNLGGLKNPYMNGAVLDQYAERLVQAVGNVLPAGTQLTVATSQATSGRVPKAQTQTPAQIAEHLQRCEFALCTPGLGNIFEAAAYGAPTLWLPPANASQGQQLQLLREAGCVDAYLDWPVLGHKVDYFAPELECLETLQRTMTSFATADGFSRLVTSLGVAIRRLGEVQAGAATGLIPRFGTDGAIAVAGHIAKWLEEGTCRAVRPGLSRTPL